MFMRKLILSALAGTAALAATPAFAQDAAAPAFNGGHIEAITGFDSIRGGGDSESGIAFGIACGYDFRTVGAVIGVEVEAADSTISESGVSAGRDLYVGGRVGGVINERGLLYAKVGYTNARASFAGTGVNFDGIRAGAGLEWMVGRNVSIRGEYRYSNYEDGLSRHQGILGLSYRF
jgi:outer membrane immunogenic protein